MFIYTDPRSKTKYISYTDVTGKRVRKSLQTKNQAVATLKAAQILDKSKAKDSGNMPLELFLTRYREFLKAARNPHTAYRFELAMRNLQDFKRVEYLRDITPALIDELAIHLKSKLKKPSAAGVNRKIQALKTAMRQAEFWDLIPPQNWRKVTRFKQSKGRIEFHTPAEIKQILDIFNEDWQLVVMLGCRAGLRKGEIARLKWADVDFLNNQLYIAPHKTEKHRFIPIADDLRRALEQAQRKAEGKEFVINIGLPESRYTKDYLSVYYQKATKGLGFHCFLHKLRHTFASHLVQAGVELYRVSKLLGHSSIKMTEIYAHLAPTDLISAIKKLPTF